MTVQSPRENTTRPAWPVLALSTLVIVAGCALVARAGLSAWQALPWFWLVTCACAEAGWIRLPDGRSTLSMGSIANFAAVLVLPLGQALVCASLACLAVETLVMRKPVQRALYNSAGTAVTIALTNRVLQAFPGAGAATAAPALLMAALAAAAAAYYVCNRALVIAVVALDQRVTPVRVWRQDFGMRRDTLPSGAAMSLGVLLAHEYQSIGPLTLVLLVFPAALVLEAHRRATMDARERERPGATDVTQRAA